MVLSELVLYSIEELRNPVPPYYLGQSLSKSEVISLFDAIRGNYSASKYRVGITCDADRREDEHNADFLAVIKCFNVYTANRLEEFAGDKGYDAGLHPSNAHKIESTRVYIYRKDEDTIE